MICIPISAANNDDFCRLIADAERDMADLLEFRLDMLHENPALENFFAATQRPVVATCRSVAEGGGFAGSRSERLTILRRAAAAGAAYIDCEAGDVDSLDGCGAVRIASFHDFTGTPADLPTRVAALAETGAEWVKFAVSARSYADVAAVFAVLASCPKPAVAIAMGPLGLVTRILGPLRGSRITFGSVDIGHESAPGQPTARELVDLYRVPALSKNTAIHGLLTKEENTDHVAINRNYRRHGCDAVCIPFVAHNAVDMLSTVPDLLDMTRIYVDPGHADAARAWVGDSERRPGCPVILERRDGRWLAAGACSSFHGFTRGHHTNFPNGTEIRATAINVRISGT